MTNALVALLLSAGPMKVAVMPLTAGEGVKSETGAAITEAVIAEVRRQPNLKVTTPAEVTALLGFERQKQLMGCPDDQSCMAEIGSALGVERLLMGSLAKLGQSWLVHLKLIDASKGSAVGQSDRRLKDKTIDEVLDQLPPMVVEVFGQAPAPAAPVEPPAPPQPTAKKSESGGADEPFEVPQEVKGVWKLLTDGKGHYIVVAGYEHSGDGFFAGDGNGFWLQRVVGSGATGTTEFNFSFWDPRFIPGYQKSLDMKNGRYELQCGEAKVAYELVAPAKAQKLLKKASFFKFRWRRAISALARDDSGAYYLVDGPREDGDESRKLRLFHGTKGKIREVALDDAISDANGMLLLSAAGKLKLPAKGDAEWIDARGTTLKLSKFELGPSEAKLIYKDLGVYAGDPLRTPCDPFL